MRAPRKKLAGAMSRECRNDPYKPPFGFPLREPLGSFPHSLLFAPARKRTFVGVPPQKNYICFGAVGLPPQKRTTPIWANISARLGSAQRLSASQVALFKQCRARKLLITPPGARCRSPRNSAHRFGGSKFARLDEVPQRKAALPFALLWLGDSVPLLKCRQFRKTSWYPYSKLSAGGPSRALDGCTVSHEATAGNHLTLQCLPHIDQAQLI